MSLAFLVLVVLEMLQSVPSEMVLYFLLVEEQVIFTSDLSVSASFVFSTGKSFSETELSCSS